MKSIIGREWLSTLKLEIALTNQDKVELIANSIEKEKSSKLSEDTKLFVKIFPELFSRKGKIKNQKVKITTKDEAKFTQQNGRREPIQLQKTVAAENKRLLGKIHIEKIDKVSNNVFIQPTVITVKKDRSVKIALDARALNRAIDKDKYQMPNSEDLIDMGTHQLI